jgi:hypothetical protein
MRLVVLVYRWVVLRLPLLPGPLALSLWASLAQAQTMGPNSPGAGANLVGGGSVSWTVPAQAFASDNTYTTATNGLSHFLRLANFGFAVPANAAISGILVEVERRANPVNPVTANTWQTYTSADYPGSGTGTTNYGTTTYSYNLPVATGNNRLLMVTIGIENVDNETATGQNPAINFTSVTYNGVPMTQATFGSRASASTSNNVAVYYLLEASLPATTGARNLVITKTIVGETGGANGTVTTPSELVEIVGVNTFSNVNQVTPILAQTNNSATSPIATPAFANLRGGDLVVAATMNNTPTVAGGSVTQAGGFTENFEVSRSNPPTTTGAILQVQSRAVPVGTTTVTASATAAGHSRLVMCAVAVISARVYDNSVMLINDGGVTIGNDFAITPAQVLPNAWPDTDTYIAYGSLGNLWGATWTPAMINDPDFGVSIQVDARNAVAYIDHVRITVEFIVLLSAHLQNFEVRRQPEGVVAHFSVVTDDRQEYTYILEKSVDGHKFVPVASVRAPGNGSTQRFSLPDDQPGQSRAYYRLRIISPDEADKWSRIIALAQEEAPAFGVVVFPNPAQGKFQIANLAGQVPLVSIADALGRRVAFDLSPVGPGQYQVQFPANLAQGYYWVTVTTMGQRVVKKILAL